MRIIKESAWFLRFAKRTAHAAGTPYAFAVALTVVLVCRPDHGITAGPSRTSRAG